MTIGWQFPPNGGGSTQGFNDSAIDTFAGRRLSAMVREIIQNSLDAADPEADGPVTVEFSLEHLPSQQLPNLDELSNHIERCKEICIEQELPAPQAFHEDALELVRKSDTVPCLVISDYNTRGLTGPTNRARGPWFALTKGNGITQKVSGSSLGSYGHGSKAPFSLARLRTLYYLSKTNNESGEEELRFQGKSILQSHYHPETNELTQGTGFYGHMEGLRPLIGAEVPEWAAELRAKHSRGKGTTLIIPFSHFSEDLFPETKITVIANFFYAIFIDKLRVKVNGEEITKENVVNVFEYCEAVLPDEQDEIDAAYIEECFKSINTIISPTDYGSQEIPKFGRIDWFIKTGDSVNGKAVAISRQSGMLITRRPTKLLRFPNAKPFDLFVFVDEGEGSAALKRLENPEHDNFQFDRIQDARDERDVKKRYESLVEKIRDIIGRYAAIDAEDEEVVSELANILSGASDLEENSAKNRERGRQLLISDGKQLKNKPPRRGGNRPLPAGFDEDGGTNEGEKEGKGGGKNPRGSKPGGGAKAVEVSGGTNDTSHTGNRVQVERMRITPDRSSKGVATITFTAHTAGEFNFGLVKVGETDLAPVKILVDGREVSAARIRINEPSKRQSYTVHFANKNDQDFAFEGWLDEIQ